MLLDLKRMNLVCLAEITSENNLGLPREKCTDTIIPTVPKPGGLKLHVEVEFSLLFALISQLEIYALTALVGFVTRLPIS